MAFKKLALAIAVVCASLLNTADAQQVYRCTKAQRVGDICPALYAPVCAWLPNKNCPNKSGKHVTYGNSCEACHDKKVESYVNGEC